MIVWQTAAPTTERTRDLTSDPRILACPMLLAIAILLSGCQASPPDFLARSQQDCARGDRDACRMLSALDPLPPRVPPSRMQTQRNVQAILRGMEQARTSRLPGYREETPSLAPETGAPPPLTGEGKPPPAATDAP